MSYAVLVKHRDAQGGTQPEILAYDISNPHEAERLALSLASSYPVHGVDAGTHVPWYYDGAGLHEIWLQAV